VPENHRHPPTAGRVPRKFLIFADFRPSVEALRAALTADGIEAVTFHGGMSALERAEAVRRFRQSARVMISTQSGSEGHNLQFCHQLINFDLPWNPMRIEQRVAACTGWANRNRLHIQPVRRRHHRSLHLKGAGLQNPYV
jgi:superfamily II DNA/RNA helicase